MRSPYYFIVTPAGGRYVTEKNGLIITTSTEDHIHSNRMAEVLELPLGYSGKIEKGDILLVHHNTFKFHKDMRGVQRSSHSFLKDNTFFVDTEQFFMYKHDVIWHTHDRFCFVRPVKAEDTIVRRNCIEEPLTGIMAYPNENLLSKGVKQGDKVIFRPFNEYEFDVDGEKLYRIYDHQICAVI